MVTVSSKLLLTFLQPSLTSSEGMESANLPFGHTDVL